MVKIAIVSLTRDYSTGVPANLSAVNYDSDREEIIAGVNSITNAQVSATAAIASTKLSGVVTLTGAESISGVKTHSKAINITIANTVNDVALEVTQNDVTNNPNAATITNAGTGNGLFVDQNGDGIGLSIDSAATTATNYGFSVKTTAGARGIFIDQNSSATSFKIDSEATAAYTVDIDDLTVQSSMRISAGGVKSANEHALDIRSSAAQVNSGMLFLYHSNGSSTAPVQTIQNVGTGNGLFINQDGNGVSLNIDSEATTQPAIRADQTVADNNFSLLINHGGANKFGVQRIDDVTDNFCILLGAYYLWVDTTGDLRIHTSAPTSDTAGAVVGTQS